MLIKYVFFFHLFFREATAKIAEIITDVGEASAKAQGLTRAVTTSQKLRNSDHVLYLLTEPNGKK
jgi:alpha-tubulin N-acetyltransferase 1